MQTFQMTTHYPEIGIFLSALKPSQYTTIVVCVLKGTLHRNELQWHKEHVTPQPSQKGDIGGKAFSNLLTTTVAQNKFSSLYINCNMVGFNSKNNVRIYTSSIIFWPSVNTTHMT